MNVPPTAGFPSTCVCLVGSLDTLNVILDSRTVARGLSEMWSERGGRRPRQNVASGLGEKIA